MRSSAERREAVIPAGHELLLVAFRSRHRALMLLAGTQGLAFVALGVVGVAPWLFGVAVPTAIGLLLLVGASGSAGRTTRASAVALALLVGALGVVHLVDGAALGELYVVVTIVLAALYQSWRPLALLVAAVTAHHVLANLAGFALAASGQRLAWTVGQVFAVVVVGGVAHVIARTAEEDRHLVWESGARPTYSVDPRGEIQHVNHAMAELFEVGVSRLIGMRDHDLFHLGARDTCEICAAVTSGRRLSALQVPLLGPAGEPFDAEVTVRPVGSTRRTLGATVTLTDVSNRVASQRRLERVARTDSLTGLGNRFQLEQDLGQIIEHESDLGRRVAMVHVDLDRFKPVNDTLGHAAGDRLLALVAERIRRTAPDDALVARVGGDEFVVVVPDAIPEEVLAGAEAMRVAVTAPIELDGRRVSVTASIGVIVVSAAKTSPAELVADADLALHHAKRAGGNRVVRFDLAMRVHADARVALVSDLHAAFDNDEFELYYQPAWNLDDDRLDGCEALLRWHHPERGLIPPAAFVPLAEESGLIVDIGRWVLTEACQQLDDWHRDPAMPELCMAVNLSTAQLRDTGLVNHVDLLLSRSSFSADQLVLELTETMLMEDLDLALPVLHELRDRGVLLSIDDFGTGFSSLSILRTLPVQEVKIDRQFLQEITSDVVGQRVMSSIIELARALELRVVAEGIESPEALEVARTLGADRAQGYALGEPMRPATFTEMYRAVSAQRRGA